MKITFAVLQNVLKELLIDLIDSSKHYNCRKITIVKHIYQIVAHTIVRYPQHTRLDAVAQGSRGLDLDPRAHVIPASRPIADLSSEAFITSSILVSFSNNF